MEASEERPSLNGEPDLNEVLTSAFPDAPADPVYLTKEYPLGDPTEGRSLIAIQEMVRLTAGGKALKGA